jgi:hypothetical protein
MIAEWPKTIAIVIENEEEAEAVVGLLRREEPRRIQDTPCNPEFQPPRGLLPPIERVALRIIASLVTLPGECMVCGCTEDEPCVIKSGDIEIPCAWINEERTLCSACLGVIL